MGLLDIVTETFDAFSNIAFIIQFTVCLWIVVASTCMKSIIHKQNILVNLRILRDSMVHARLGGVLR
jgi:hypothetical protein